MNHKLSLATILLAGTLPLAALAADSMTPSAGEGERVPSQPGTQGGPVPDANRGDTTTASPMFVQLDRNSDGKISKEEAKRSAEIQAMFDTLDVDRDGSLSAAEWDAYEASQKGGKS